MGDARRTLKQTTADKTNKPDTNVYGGSDECPSQSSDWKIPALPVAGDSKIRNQNGKEEPSS